MLRARIHPVPSRPGPHRTPIVVGLVNNMPDAALQRTARQFRELLAAASGGQVHLRLLYLPEIPRTPVGRSLLRRYRTAHELRPGDVDALIVTGTEPHSPDLRDEPYWAALTRLADWACEHTTSTVWSCLAAHAAALHLDGVGRRRLPEKLSGVFECIKAVDHPLTTGAPGRWSVPHSRYNELPAANLVLHGHLVISNSPEAGADIFVKQHDRCLSVFMQGHPEYDAGTLLREYRRDVRRFLTGERDSYPVMPRGCFDATSEAKFTAFRTRALQCRSPDLIRQFPTDPPQLQTWRPWHGPAIQIYTNWLSYVAARPPIPRPQRAARLASLVENRATGRLP